MAGDLNLDTAIHAGTSVVDGYLDRNLNRGEQIAREVIEAALPHILEAAAQKIDSPDPHAMIYMSDAALFIRSLGWNPPPDGSNATVSVQRPTNEECGTTTAPSAPERSEGVGGLSASDGPHGWTKHGHPCCREGKLAIAERPPVARCGGPHMCKKCSTEVQSIHWRPSCVEGA